MRVSVDLSKYFNDHRSLAYIFINKKTMPYIQHVEERITKIFNIDNFYLIQQDHYLPPLEDVSLLVDDCDLCVIPVDQSNCTVSDDCSTKPKKNKKKKKKTEEQIEETMDIEREDLENDGKLKQNRKRKLIKENNEDENDDKLKMQKKKAKIDKHNQTIYTSRRETFKEHLDKILVKKDEIIKRSPNIVKTIIVSGNNLIKTDDSKEDALNNSSNDSSSSTETRNEPNTAEDVVKPIRRRKRTRTRKRKQRIVNNGETIQQYPKAIENITPKLPSLQKASGLHIRFSDEEQVEETQPETKSETQQQEEITAGNDKNTVENSNNNKINDSYILKQPLIIDILPKINDLIAFKILRLNETYAPELSPFIIGKLIALNVDGDKEVTFDIKQGLDYCLPPQGKFSIETEEQTSDQKTTEYTFKWSELIEPRLIYP